MFFKVFKKQKKDLTWVTNFKDDRSKQNMYAYSSDDDTRQTKTARRVEEDSPEKLHATGRADVIYALTIGDSSL